MGCSRQWQLQQYNGIITCEHLLFIDTAVAVSAVFWDRARGASRLAIRLTWYICKLAAKIALDGKRNLHARSFPAVYQYSIFPFSPQILMRHHPALAYSGMFHMSSPAWCGKCWCVDVFNSKEEDSSDLGRYFITPVRVRLTPTRPSIAGSLLNTDNKAI